MPSHPDKQRTIVPWQSIHGEAQMKSQVVNDEPAYVEIAGKFRGRHGFPIEKQRRERCVTRERRSYSRKKICKGGHGEVKGQSEEQSERKKWSEEWYRSPQATKTGR